VDVPEAFGEVFNIGADTAYSVNELARVVCDAFGVEPRIRHLPERNEVMHAYANHEKARRLLGVKGTTGLDEGIRRMAEWARGVGARRSQAFGEIEISRDLPPVWLEGEAHSRPANPLSGGH
jgi:UDP-glucose 4-epimerase